MLNFNTFFTIKRILHIRRELIFFMMSEKKKICKLFFLGLYIMPLQFFLYTFPLKSLGIVKTANLLKRILISLLVVRKQPKDFYRSWKIRQKYLIVCGELRQFQNGFVYTKSSMYMPKVFQRAWRTPLKGPRHDQVGYVFFCIEQTRMVR